MIFFADLFVFIVQDEIIEILSLFYKRISLVICNQLLAKIISRCVWVTVYTYLLYASKWHENSCSFAISFHCWADTSLSWIAKSACHSLSKSRKKTMKDEASKLTGWRLFRSSELNILNPYLGWLTIFLHTVWEKWQTQCSTWLWAKMDHWGSRVYLCVEIELWRLRLF